MVISPIEREWTADGGLALAISGWEHETGLRLPDDYRGFTLRNGRACWHTPLGERLQRPLEV